MMRTIFYYSFVVGLPNDKEEFYRFDDLKLPAYSPIAAMFLRQVMHSFKPKQKIYEYDKDKIFSVCRQVYEYELTGKRGKTTLVFTLKNIYNVSETLFKNFK